jgi:hypothetical protein
MAFDQKGAYWIDEKESQDKRNPYFGHTPVKGQDMLKCGELTETILPETDKTETSLKAEQTSAPKRQGADDESRDKPGKSGSASAPEKHDHGSK